MPGEEKDEESTCRLDAAEVKEETRHILSLGGETGGRSLAPV
jgi:hypothetical protein